jgi:hypothetical protein
MKPIISVYAVALAIITSCNSVNSKDEVEEFIPGTYVHHSENEYGKGFDTLVISLQNESANEYKIVRKTRYNRILDGKALEPDYKTKTTSGIYDADKKLLQESQSLNIFTFNVSQKILLTGTNQFNKIN